METEIKKILDDEIKLELKQLSNCVPHTEEEAAVYENLSKLIRLKTAEINAELKLENDIRKQKQEVRIQEKQLKERIIDRYFGVGIAAAELILPLLFYGMWMRRGFEFEKTGTFTSTTFRGLFNRFKPTNNK